jgi:branched-subunit amino acid transport protein
MINSTLFWVAITILAIGTYIIRYSFLAFANKLSLSERHRELLTYVPACLLPALVASMVYSHEGSVTWLYGKERIAILAFSIPVFIYSRNIVITLLFGLGALYLVTHMG